VIDRRALTLALVAGALAAPGLAAAAEPAAATAPATVPGRVIVQWAPGAARPDKEAAREGAEVTYQANLGDPTYQLVQVEPGQSVGGAVAELESAPAVEVAEPDTYAEPTALPDDPLLGDQWALRNLGTGIDGFGGAVAGDDIDAADAWQRTVGIPSVVVADIDSGYRFNSPDLGPVAWENPGEIAGNGVDDDGDGYIDDVRGWDFVGEDAEAPTEDADPTDSDLISGGHGVHTAGIIGAAGNNGAGITGVAQNVRIMPLRVCANVPSLNELRCPTSSLIAAINYAGQKGARVANMSLTSAAESIPELHAIAENPGTLYVAAAGNEAQDNDSHRHYPCDFEPGATGISGAVENVVCVAATDQADGLASFSDWGAHTVDLGAPGTQILSTYPAFEEIAGDDFEAEDFDTRWKVPNNANAEGGFERTNEAPLTSFGISDSPGRTPVANSIRSSQLSSPVPVSAEAGSCTLTGLDSVSLGGGTFKATIFKNSFAAFTFSISSTAAGMHPFSTGVMTGLDGASVGLRLTYTAGAAPTPGSGIWVDNLRLSCYAPLSTPPTYAYLEGTSMAAPEVSGTAALLFSEKPDASVEEVSEALLEGAVPDPALAGKTVSGGRLDAARALAWLDLPAPILRSDPLSPAEDEEPTILGTAAAGTRVRVFEDKGCTGPVLVTGTAAELESPGFSAHVPPGTRKFFSARAEIGAESSPCSATLPYTDTHPFATITVPLGEKSTPSATPAPPTSAPIAPASSCTVPKLAGKTLGRATGALKRAGCAVGKAKTTGRKGAKASAEVVVASSPAAGAKTSAAVSLRLAPKPAKRHR
jgi:subtilisin family serine protease